MREEVWGTDEFGLDLMVSDAAKEYLKTAIQLDDSYLLTAQKDAYLPEDLVTEVTAELEKKP